MNIRPVVLAIIIVGCSVLGWIIGRHTLVYMDSTSTTEAKQQTGQANSAGNSNNFPSEQKTSTSYQTGSNFIDNISNRPQIKSSFTNQKVATQGPQVENQNSVLLKGGTGSKATVPRFTPNIQQVIRNITPSANSVKSLKVYTHDKNSWILGDDICKTSEKLIRVWLKNSVGDTPIYIHDPSHDIWISRDLQTKGHWEGGFVNLVYRLLQEDKDLQFVDLGANIGVYALSVAKFGRKVIAVEPLSINLQRLCKSVEEGVSTDGKAFADKITIIHNALSDVRENVQLGKDRNNVGGTFVLKDSNEKKVQGSSVAGRYNDVVMTTKLDDLLDLPNFDFKKVVLKIDVEGYESKAFNGGQKFFDTVDVKAILMEWRWHTGARDIQNLLDFFVNRKYKAFDPKTIPPTSLDIANVGSWPGDVLWQK